MLQRPSFFAVLALPLLAFAACSDDDPATPPAITADAAPPDAEPNGGPDAAPEGLPVEGSLTIAPVGTSSMPAGTFTPKTGSAQWRPKTAGGVLTVTLEEESGRAIELTLYDDAGSLDANESFGADAPGSFALHKARGETFKDGMIWRSRGDGNAIVKAFTSTAVTLELQTFGQEAQGIVADVFTLVGTVTVPITTLAPATGAAASLAISNVLPEPITNEPNNMAGSSKAVAAASSSLDERTVPFAGTRRAVDVSDTAGGTKRTVRVTFPSGHTPRPGQTLPLDAFDRVTVSYFEGDAPTETSTTKVWEADQGSAEVTARTATSLTLKLVAARMQSESPAAKGLFTLDGTLTFPIP